MDISIPLKSKPEALEQNLHLMEEAFEGK